jgi:hypothetical protein
MPPNPQHAIAPGRIHCQISEEADGTRRYVLQVPEAAVPVAEACVEDLMSGRYQRQAQAEQDVVTAGVSALHRLLKRVEDNWHTGQARRIMAFLAGLYNGTDYPFDLTELRAVDRDIAADCLALLTLDTRGIKEVHRYIENGDAKWAAMIEDYGLKPAGRG